MVLCQQKKGILTSIVKGSFFYYYVLHLLRVYGSSLIVLMTSFCLQTTAGSLGCDARFLLTFLPFCFPFARTISEPEQLSHLSLQCKCQQFGALPIAHHEEGAVRRAGHSGGCGVT